MLSIFIIGCIKTADKCCCVFEKEPDIGCIKELFENDKKVSVWKIKCPKNPDTGLPAIKEFKSGFIKDKIVDIVSYRCDGVIIRATKVRIVNNIYADGEILWRRNNETKFLSENYKAGKLEGKWLFYGTNGKVRIEQNFINGDKVGVFIHYFENGRIYQKGLYDKRSRAIGVWKTYNENGKLIKTTKF